MKQYVITVGCEYGCGGSAVLAGLRSADLSDAVPGKQRGGSGICHSSCGAWNAIVFAIHKVIK